jgi:hypothetical protein
VTLAWVQDNLAGPRPHQQIQGYNLDTRTEFTILETADLNTLGSIALDKGILYYSDSTNGHSGMFAHTLATGQERRIHATPIGGDLVVKDGVMLWSDVRFSGEPGPGDGTLHILKLDGSLGDTVIAHGQNGFSGYDLSGDLVAWSAFGSQVYLYHISSGTSEPVSPGPASLASISGRQIGWVSWPDNRPGQPARWLLQLSNLDEGSTRTLDEETGLQTSPFIAVVGPHVVAYTKYDTPGIRTLYVIDLP